MRISELYGKGIITNSGKRVGSVEDIILDFEEGRVAYLITAKIDLLAKSENLAREIKSKSVDYSKVYAVSSTVVVRD
ncbi:MAG: PRC-barrel domain-containing protein [Candidatus Micrarchaeia archaeon]